MHIYVDRVARDSNHETGEWILMLHELVPIAVLNP